MPYVSDRELASARQQTNKARIDYCAACQKDTPHLFPKYFSFARWSASHGRVCLECGWEHVRRKLKDKRLRAQVYEADNYECVYCGRTERIGLDHIVPQSRGGADTFNNLLTACHWCNALRCDGRTNLTPRYGRFK